MKKISLAIFIAAAALLGAMDQPWPKIPASMRETPWIPENDSSAEPTPEENRNGALIFTRHLTEPVWPRSRPEKFERAGVLRGFAARGQKLTFNFALLPLTELRDIKVNVSPCTGSDGGTIAPERFDAKLVSFWPVKYPLYSSRSTFRVMPEFLDGFDSFGTRAGMPRRIFLTLDTPVDAVPGIYRTAVTVTHRAGRHEIPLEFKVYDFELKSDPAMRYSVYQAWHRDNLREPQFPGRSAEWYERAAANDFAAMRACGLNNYPGFFMSCIKGDDGRLQLHIPYFEENLPLMKQAGFDGPVPVIDFGFGTLYREFTGKDAAKHIILPEPPPEAMFSELDRMLKEFRETMKRNGYPPMIFCPLDEISPQSTGIGMRIYKIFRDNGLRTFATKDPSADPAAATLAPWVNAWSSQGFISPAERKPDVEYWAYPNHNAYEIKDPLTMCRGGRMTYGFGFWRSGYRMLMPWVWRSANRNHLDARYDAGGNRLEEDGSVTLTTYWTNFREGVTDAQYVYTLRYELHVRRNASDPALRRELVRSRKLLESLWNRIPVRKQYMADNSPVGAELDAWRQELAEAISRLRRFPENAGGFPEPMPLATQEQEAAEETLPESGLEKFDLLAGSPWRSISGELKLIPAGSRLDLKIGVDYRFAGENDAPDIRIGWPRMSRTFGKAGLDLSRFDFLRIRLTIDSNRDDEAKLRTPVYIQLTGGTGFKRDFYIMEASREGEVFTILYPLQKVFDAAPAEAVREIRELQLGIKEREYRDGDHLKFSIHSFELLSFTEPVIERVEIPGTVSADNGRVEFKVRVLAPGKGREGILCKLIRDGKTVRTTTLSALNKLNAGAFDLSGLKPGEYAAEFRLPSSSAPAAVYRLRVLPGIFNHDN